MAGLTEDIQVGVREDLSNVISIADAASTPAVSMIKKGQSLGNTYFEWQVDDYEDADVNSVVDGSDVDTSTAAGYTDTDIDGSQDIGENYTSADLGNKLENPARKRTRLGNYGHYWRRAFRVSTLAEDVSNVAGAASEIAKGLAKKTTELKRSMEKTVLGNQNAATPAGSQGYVTRGLGSWTTSGDYSAGNSYYAPNSGAIASVSTGTDLTDDDLQDVLKGIFTETGTYGDLHLIAGTALRRAFSNLLSSTSVTNFPVAIRSIQSTDQSTYNTTLDVVAGDFGKVMVHPDLFTPDANTGYVIDPSKLELRYGFLPRSRKLTNNGGGEGRYIEAFGGLVVENPKCLGRIKINQ